MEQYVLVKHQDNYADAFDINTVFVFKYDEFNKHLKRIEETFENIDIYFGTNEWLTYESFEDFMDTLNIKYISDKEYHEFRSLMNCSAFGSITHLFDCWE